LGPYYFSKIYWNYYIINFMQVEELFKKAHAAIRKDPTHAKPDKKASKGKRWNAKKLTLEERKAKVKAAKDEFLAQIESQKE
jgi:large subunit ribosomal protein L5e